MAIIVTIAGTDRTADIMLNGVSIQQVLTYQEDSMEFTVMSGIKPTAGMSITVVDGSTTLFGGIIDGVKAEHQPGGITFWDCTARDYSYQMNAKLVADVWENHTADEIVKEILASYTTGFTSVGVDSGAPNVEYFFCDYEKVSDALKRLCEYVGWEWYVDYSKDVQFFDPSTRNTAAPIQLTDATDIRNWKHNIDEQGLVNRVYVIGGTMLSDPETFTFVADGQQTVFNLAHKPHNLTMTVAAVAVTVGTENLDEDDGSHQYMMNYQEKYVKCGSGTAAEDAGTNVAFTYQYDIPVITLVEDIDSQNAVAAVQGGDGIYEHRISDSSLTTLEAAEAAGNAYLREHSNPRVTGSFSTAQSGWDPGQILTVNSTSRSISGTFTVQKVKIKPYGTGLLYTIEYGGRIKGIEDKLKALVSAQQASRNQDTAILSVIKSKTDTVTATDSTIAGIKAPPYYVADAIPAPTFTRASVAYKSDGTQVIANAPRYETTGIIIEEGTTNLLTVAQSQITGSWNTFSGSTVNITQNQTVSEWETNIATRIQGFGGTNVIKCICVAGIGTNGLAYSLQLKIQNNGTTNIVVASNRGSKYQTVTPGQVISIKWENIISNGSDSMQFQLRAATIDGSIDVIVFQPQWEQKVYCTTWQIGGTARVAEVLSLPTTGVFAKGSWSVEMTYTPQSTIVSGQYCVLWETYIDANNRYLLYIEGSKKLCLYMLTSGSAKTISTSYDIVAGTTYKNTAVGNGTTLRLFVNGSQIGVDTAYTEPVGTLPANMYIGGQRSGIYQVNGIIGDFRVSNKARTLAEHQAAYADGRYLDVDDDTTYKLNCDGSLIPEINIYAAPVCGFVEVHA